MKERVVVTGLGAVSPLGLSMEDTWQALMSGKSGVGRLTRFDPAPFNCRIAAEVKGFDPCNYLDRKEVRHSDRFVHYAVAASREAVKMSALKIEEGNATDIGVLVGSGIGGLSTLFEQTRVLLEKGPDRVSPFLAPMMVSDMASGQLSISLGVKGPNFCTTSSCASSADAIGTACNLIRDGYARVMISGGSEAALTPIGLAAFDSARAVSTRNDEPEKASRPFDALRDGFVIGEGAAALVLEALSHALGRGANILAELVGYGATGDAFHITQPAPNAEGGARAMKKALETAGIRPDEVSYINAHGTSTPLNDKFETMAIKKVFGEYAYKVPISSTKSMTGHLLGAAGAIEAAICVNAIGRGIIPPTINLTSPDPDCDLDYVPHTVRKKDVEITLSNSFGFGGHNSVLIFRKFRN